MSDLDMTDLDINCIAKLCDEAMRIADEHGFKDNSVGEDIALMHSELSEALEDFRAGRPLNLMHYESDQGARTSKPCGVPSELADVCIRIFHFSARHGIDLGQAIKEKMAFNETRPFKHGNKKI